MNAAFRLREASDLAERRGKPIRWQWHEYFAAGLVTLLTSRWKTGKTTLFSLLAQRLQSGAPLGGTPFAASRMIVVSEEPDEMWEERVQSLGLHRNFKWICRPFLGRPTFDEWQGLIDFLAADGADFIAIDTLPYFLPGDVENSPTKLLEALQPLHRLTNTGAAVVLAHHPKKGGHGVELGPRGTGALTAFADILVELNLPRHAPITDRRRIFQCTSRLRGSSIRTFELAPGDRELLLLPDPPDCNAFEVGWAVLKTVFEDSDTRLTRRQILKDWPEDHDKPSKSTLHRWLSQALKEGKIQCKGKGRTNDPFLYFLPVFVPFMEDLPPLEPLRNFMRR